MVVVFFAGSAVYLWLALNDIPYFRLEDIEPSLLIHGLVIAQGGGYNFALLFVSFFWGVAFVVAYLFFQQIQYFSLKVTHLVCFTGRRCIYCGIIIFLLFITLFNITICFSTLSLERKVISRTENTVMLLKEFKKEYGRYPKKLEELSVYKKGGSSRLRSRLALRGNDYEECLVTYKSDGDTCNVNYQMRTEYGEKSYTISLN